MENVTKLIRELNQSENTVEDFWGQHPMTIEELEELLHEAKKLSAALKESAARSTTVLVSSGDEY